MKVYKVTTIGRMARTRNYSAEPGEGIKPLSEITKTAQAVFERMEKQKYAYLEMSNCVYEIKGTK